VVLKGNTTITASPEGKYIVNTTGNPGMAKGGSGDVLAGIIGSLAGQHISLAEAAAAGVFIHGAAGNLAAERLGEYGMLPSDIISDIPNVLKKYNSTANNNTTRGGT
jgi:NAD(P)H-hydrate epimerase